MTATVKIFTISGLVTAPVVAGTGLAYDSLQMLKMPYEGRDNLSCETVTADTSEASAATSGTRLAYVQVQPGKTVAYEVTPQGFDLRAADANSPMLTGSSVLLFGPGYRLSVIEVAAS